MLAGCLSISRASFRATDAGEVTDRKKDLYDHAFVLFALAYLHRAFALPANASATYCKRKLPAATERCRRRGWAHATISPMTNTCASRRIRVFGPYP